MRVAVYKHYADGHVLLYVGRAIDLKARTRSHAKHAPWWQHVVYVEWQYYSTYEDAIVMENEAILHERPIFNKAGPERLKDPVRILPYWYKEYYGVE